MMFMTKISRRTFIGGSAAMGALLTSPELVKALTSQPYPRVKVANIRNLRVGEPVSFNYPYAEGVEGLIWGREP
jgi:arsenite oxidase small subunit